MVHVYNWILLSYLKECIWNSSNEVDETGAYYMFLSFFLKIYFYFCLCWVFVAAQASLWLWRVGGYSLVVWGARVSHCSGFSCYVAQALGCVGFSRRGSQTTGSEVVLGLSYSRAYGVLQDQGWKLCLLHWQADFLPLSYQGSPHSVDLGQGLRTFISNKF